MRDNTPTKAELRDEIKRLRAALEETQATIDGMIEQSLLRNVEPDASDLADLLVIIRAALKGTVTPLVTVHTCSCGLAYTAATWAALPLCGTQEDGEGGELELRHCPCGSTRSVPTAKPPRQDHP